jgi:hypothetical protein
VKRTSTIVTEFIGEWIFVAFLPVYVPFVFLFLTSQSSWEDLARDLELPTEAIFCYALAVTYAFLERLDLSSWRSDSRRPVRALGETVQILKPLLIIVSILSVAWMTAARFFMEMASIFDAWKIFVVGTSVAFTAVTLAILTLVHSPLQAHKEA